MDTQQMRGSKHPWIGAGVAALAMAFCLICSTAAAADYRNSPPQFDRMTMLRVAWGYNMTTNPMDERFPVTSDRRCDLAGVSTVTFVQFEHNRWISGPGYPLMKQSIEAAIGAAPRHYPCYWLVESEMAAAFFGDLARVWPATQKPNFNRLREALWQSNRKAIYRLLEKYPEASIAPKSVREKIDFMVGHKG